MKIFRYFLAASASLALAGLMLAAGLFLYIEPQLPAIDSLRDVRFQVPMRIYSRDQRLISEFGEKRRIPVTIEDVPQQMVQAFLAAEDDRFYVHPGVDYQGLLRAVFELIRTGEKRQGGSTITMQVARNFFLSAEKTYLRKLTEIFLALKIERELSKAQILELYLNKIYLGQRAYGIGAAAQVYYGLPVGELRLDQMAVIAGLPKAPSRDNPVTSPERARDRRDYVLRRLYTLGQIDASQFKAAVERPIDAELHLASVEVEAPYVAEMVRADLIERFGENAYTEGYQVYTTLDSRRQAAANQALRQALLAYDQRHGYRGAMLRLPVDEAGIETSRERLRDQPTYGPLLPALVTEVAEQQALLELRDGSVITLPWDGISWARRYISHDRRGGKPDTAGEVLTPGDLVYVMTDEEAGWRLAQLPEIEGALVSLLPDDGAIQALVGGFDFHHSKFNRAAQAERQPGSGFKPVIYSSALEKGFTPASIINDAPVVFDDPSLEKAWRPENYSGRFYGPTRLREALTFSRNLISIRLLQAVGVPYAIEYAQRFGFSEEQLPHNLSLSLGSASVTPLQMARAYAVFANGGYLIEPYFIDHIMDSRGELVFQARPRVVCRDCDDAPAGKEVQEGASVPGPEAEPGRMDPAVAGAVENAVTEQNALPEAEPAPQVLSPQNVWLMQSMMQDVIKRGTGRRALQLGRTDLAGKTGTTNDQRDAWFSGFSPALVTIAWVGFDAVEPLGRGETGGRAALPMWIDYMRVALDGVPEIHRDPPPGLVTVRIDPATGLLASSGDSQAIFETFRAENVPTETAMTGTQPPADEGGGADAASPVDNLF